MEWLRRLLGRGRAPHVAQVSTVRKAPDGVYVIRICGVLSKATLTNIQNLAAAAIEKGSKQLRVLLLLENFVGWKKGDDWGDLDFLAQYGENISKIAAVADAARKEEVMLFLLAGQRPGEVRFFPLGHEDRARAWLVE